jgi:hypothetical protein
MHYLQRLLGQLIQREVAVATEKDRTKLASPPVQLVRQNAVLEDKTTITLRPALSPSDTLDTSFLVARTCLPLHWFKQVLLLLRAPLFLSPPPPPPEPQETSHIVELQAAGLTFDTMSLGKGSLPLTSSVVLTMNQTFSAASASTASTTARSPHHAERASEQYVMNASREVSRWR